MIRLAMRSVGNTVIIPMQDILGLDEKARMNMPSVAEGNWTWRLADGQLTKDLAKIPRRHDAYLRKRLT